jgi:hypothetical protein
MRKTDFGPEPPPTESGLRINPKSMRRDADPIVDQVQKILLESLDQMPEIIRSALLMPKMSTTSRLKWAGMAIRLLYDPVDRAVNDVDRKNKREAANILREVVPELQKIRERNSSERLRRKADQYLRVIAAQVP